MERREGSEGGGGWREEKGVREEGDGEKGVGEERDGMLYFFVMLS